MSAPSADVIRWGRERVRTGLWRGDRRVAYLAPVPDAPLPSAEFLRRCMATLAQRGFTRVVTGALSPLEQAGFLAAGFFEEERLHLLGIDLVDGPGPVPDGLVLRRVPRRRWGEVLRVDRAAFPPFWQFDELGLDDALRATPKTRFRMAVPDRSHPAVGYAVCGQAGRRGFVQRLAVDPAWQGQGTGRRLLLDGLDWLRRSGADRAVVNTQQGNEAALGLYLRTGFREEPTGLSVLSAGLA